MAALKDFNCGKWCYMWSKESIPNKLFDYWTLHTFNGDRYYLVDVFTAMKQFINGDSFNGQIAPVFDAERTAIAIHAVTANTDCKSPIDCPWASKRKPCFI